MEAAVSPVFRSFIPKWTAKLLLFVLLVPNMLLFFLPMANEAVAAGYFGIEPAQVRFMVVLYYAGFASFYSLERRFYAYFTYKRYFIVFQLVQLLCCVVFFKSDNVYLLYAVRFFQGMLFASAVNLYLSMMAMKIKTFRAREVSYSLFFGMLLCAGGVNNVVTADIIDAFNFDFLFHCAVLLYALNLFIVLVTMKINTETRSFPLIRLDLPGFLLLSVFLCGVGYCSTFGQQYYWLQSSELRRVAAASLSALLLFVVRQLTAKRPYIDLKVMTYPKLLIGIALLFFMYICRFSFSYSGAFFSKILGMDPRHVSYMYMVNLMGIVCGVLYSCLHLIKKRSVFWVWIPGFLSLFVYHFIMNREMAYFGNPYSYFLPLFLHGAGIGLLMVPVILYCISSVPYYLAPSAAALCLLVRFLGYSASNLLVNYYTLYHAAVHRNRFMEYFVENNAVYEDRLTLFRAKLLKAGYSGDRSAEAARALMNADLDKHILLRSVMDYYSLMMYLSIGVLVFLIGYGLLYRKVRISLRPLLPI